MPVLTRRQMLTGIAATSGLAALGGGIAVGHDHRPDLVRGILRRSFGDFRIADDQFAAFLTDIEKPFAPSRQRLAFYRAASLTSPERVKGWAPAGIGQEFEEYERRVVTAFATRTDYLAIDATAQTVSFVGDASCASPFARFD